MVFLDSRMEIWSLGDFPRGPPEIFLDSRMALASFANFYFRAGPCIQNRLGRLGRGSRGSDSLARTAFLRFHNDGMWMPNLKMRKCLDRIYKGIRCIYMPFVVTKGHFRVI